MKKAAVIVTFIFLTVGTVSALLIYNYFNAFSDKKIKDGGSIIEPKQIKSGEAFNVLLLGVDIGTVGSKNSPQRSDTMLVLHYDPNTAEASMVSIPRDTRVLIKGRYEKINAANVFGGTGLAIKTVEELLNININYYVEVDYQGFRKLIDAIGGMDIIIPFDMDYDDDTQQLHIHFKKGQKLHMNGEMAEEYVRWRKNNDGSGYAEGDLGRIKTQQEFIVKVMEKLKSPSIIPVIPSIMKILPQYINTNMDPMTIMKLVTGEMPRININSIQKYTLQGQSKIIGGIWYFICEPEKNMDIVSILGGKVNYPKDISNSKLINKKIIIQVLNGSGVNGAADSIKRELEEKGYTVIGTGNISGVKFKSSHIIDKTLKSNNATKVASELDIKSIEKNQDTLSKVDIVVVLGTDKGAALN